MNAILAGILQGAGLGGQALAQQREEARKQAATAEAERHNRAMETYAQDANIMELPTSQVPAPFRTAGADPNGTMRVSKSVLPLYQQLRTDEQNRVAGEGAKTELLRAATTPPQPTSTLAPGEDPEAAAYIGATPTKVDPRMAALANAIPFLYKNPEAGKAVVEAMKPPAPHAVAPGTALVDNSGKVIYAPPAPASFTPPAGYRPRPTRDETTGKVSTAYEPPPWQHEVAAKALADIGWKPGMPGYDTEFFNAVSQLTPVTEGGGAATRSQGLRPPAGPPGAPPQATPTTTRITGPTKPPEAAERKQLADIDSLRGRLADLISAAGNQKTSGAGTLFENPGAVIRRNVQGATGLPLAGKLSSTEMEFPAALSSEMAKIRNILFGVRVTAPELATTAPAFPTGPADPALIPKLRNWDKWFEANRAGIENALRQSNRVAPSAPAATGTPRILDMKPVK